MKKNGGFSLTEMLVVIAILSIITIIVIPIISQLKSEGNKTYYLSLEDMINATVSDYYSVNRSELPSAYTSNNIAGKILIDFISDNAIINDVVDVDGNKCDYNNSYVIVKNDNGSISNHLCLKCNNYQSSECEELDALVKNTEVDKSEVTEFSIIGVDASSSSEMDLVTNGVDVSFLIDVSGSMSGKISDVKNIVALNSENFIDKLLNKNSGINFRISISTFSSGGDTLIALTDDATNLKKTVKDLSIGGFTNLYAGLESAKSSLDGSSNKKVIIILSDGETNSGKSKNEILEFVNERKNEGIIVYAIGYSTSDSWDNFLKSVSCTENVLSSGVCSNALFYKTSDTVTNDIVATIDKLGTDLLKINDIVYNTVFETEFPKYYNLDEQSINDLKNKYGNDNVILESNDSKNKLKILGLGTISLGNEIKLRFKFNFKQHLFDNSFSLGNSKISGTINEDAESENVEYLVSTDERIFRVDKYWLKN